MYLSAEDKEKLRRELQFLASRSSGPGGQNVNKVNSRIELRFDIFASVNLNAYLKERLRAIAGKRVSSEGILIISVQDDRSQVVNRELATERFFSLVELAAKPVKIRHKTKPAAGSIHRRLEKKKQRAAVKTLRKFKPLADD